MVRRDLKKSSRTAHDYSEQRMVGEDEQSEPSGSAKDKIDGAFGHVYASYLLTGRIVDENLSIRNVHIAMGIYGDTLAAAAGEWLEIAERAVVIYERVVSHVFRLAAHVNSLASRGAGKTIRIQVVGEAPAG